jgi:hypothetical protein
MRLTGASRLKPYQESPMTKLYTLIAACAVFAPVALIVLATAASIVA